MSVCSFLGNSEIYDVEIDSMLQNAIDRVVNEAGKTEFLCYRSITNAFFKQCFSSVLKAKAHHPEDITITLVFSEKDYSENGTDGIPACMVDRIICLEEKYFEIAGGKQVMLWMLRQSTHLISGLYENLYDPENYILKVAQNRVQKKANLHIVDITDADTVQEILTCNTAINERERYIFENLNNGGCVEDIAATLGIGKNRVKQVLSHGCKSLRQCMRKRYYKMYAEKREQQKSVCSVFALGEVTYESLKTFEYIVNFLISKCGVTHFEINADDQNSGFMYVLKRYRKSEQLLCDTEAAHDRTSADMIDRSDFCICNLSSTPSAKKEHIFQARRTVLVDMRQVRAQMPQVI